MEEINTIYSELGVGSKESTLDIQTTNVETIETNIDYDKMLSSYLGVSATTIDSLNNLTSQLEILNSNARGLVVDTGIETGLDESYYNNIVNKSINIGDTNITINGNGYVDDASIEELRYELETFKDELVDEIWKNVN